MLAFLFGWAARWMFGRRWHRRLNSEHGWFKRYVGSMGNELPADPFDEVERLLRDGEARPVLLLCALVADCERAFTPRISPWRRRRKSGFALLFKSPPAEWLGMVSSIVAPRHVVLISAIDAAPNAKAAPGDGG